ncbi:MAG: pyrroloquinoline quinone biosynthesis protein PqqB [Candidatus Acidiferrales bacterium]|jgi:pyrroloquinoline quinone biosynthesis protein B
MRVKILGSGAGGGFPQWNCGCSNCNGLRAAKLHGSARTQTQIAFSVNSKAWFLLNASPDLRTQILATPELAPPEGSRQSPITGVFLPSADVDSIMGLLHLREFTPFRIFATPAVQQIVREENTIFRVLDRAMPPVQWLGISMRPQFARVDSDPREDSSFRCSAVSLGGSYPDYVSDALRGSLPADQAVVGLLVEQGEKRLFFAPSLPGRNQEWKKLAESSDLVFLDGTFWSDDELSRAAGSGKTARAIGHLPLSGTDGLLQQFSGTGRGRRVLIHINNTNPILDEESTEYHQVREMGWEIAHDGMEFAL